MSVALDTNAAVKNLERGGFTHEQSVALTNVLADALNPLATKQDIAQLEKRMDVQHASFEKRMDVKHASLEARMDVKHEKLEARMDAFEERMKTNHKAQEEHLDGSIHSLRLEMRACIAESQRNIIIAVIAMNGVTLTLAKFLF